MIVSIILTYHTSAKIFRYIKHEIKKCHTRNTVLCYVCDMYCYMCNTANIITECNLVTNISQEGTIIQSQFMYQRYNKIRSMALFHRNTLPHPMERCRRLLVCMQSQLSDKVMGKNDDVIVQSPQGVAPLWHSNANHNSAARVAS